MTLGLPGALVPGALLLLDGLAFCALLEGLIRERGEEAEKAVNDLYDAHARKTAKPAVREADRAAQIERLMRFGG